jgi:hypothetical protein
MEIEGFLNSSDLFRLLAGNELHLHPAMRSSPKIHVLGSNQAAHFILATHKGEQLS